MENSSGVKRIEYWLDGTFIGATSNGGTFQLDTEKYADGYHEMRISTVDAAAVATRTSVVREIQFDNRGIYVDFTLKNPNPDVSDNIVLNGKCSQNGRVEILGHGQFLGESPCHDGSFETQVAAGQIGVGTAEVYARLLHDGREIARSRWQKFTINAKPAAGLIGIDTTDVGLTGELIDVDGTKHRLDLSKGANKILRKHRLKSIEQINISGAFHVSEAGFTRNRFRNHGRRNAGDRR